MFDKWLKIPAHYYLHITALVILTVGVCLHNTLMSIGAIWIIANWLIEAKFKLYWTNFKANRGLWALYGFFILGFISLLWTTDFEYANKDMAQKVPLFVVPLVMGTRVLLEKKVLHFLLYVFLGVLLLTSGINYYRYNVVLEVAVDIREMSYFISHVRFAVLMALGMVVCIYFLKVKSRLWWLFIPIFAWLIYYTLKSQTINGYVLLLALAFLLSAYLLISLKNQLVKILFLALCTAVTMVFFLFVNSSIKSYTAPVQFTPQDVPQYTVNGRLYMHSFDVQERENGNLIWMFVQVEELENEWNNRSSIAYDSLDRKGQPMFGTILRYMTSKGINKDSVGVHQLTEEDISLIENGTTSTESNSGVRAKFHEFLYQYETYQNGGDPNGQSLLQRLEHFKIAFTILGDNWLGGVGIGDVQKEFENEYERSNSKLLVENRHRAHSQFLTFWISHGIIGFTLFMIFFFAPFVKRKQKDLLFYGVMFILFVACIFQDLIETQAGISLFALFYSIVANLDDANLEVQKED